MSKLVAVWQDIKIQYISLYGDNSEYIKIGGEVIKSNFFDTGRKCIIPIYSSIKDKLHLNDTLKIIFYTPKEDKQDELIDGMKATMFKPSGIVYKLWSKEKDGWDIILDES